MTPLALALVCLSAAPVEAPKPAAEPIRISVRISDQGRLLLAPTLQTTSGRTAEILSGDHHVKVTPTARPDGSVRLRLQAEQTTPDEDGVGRTERRMNVTADVTRDTVIEIDYGVPRIALYRRGGEPTVVPLGRTPLKRKAPAE